MSTINEKSKRDLIIAAAIRLWRKSHNVNKVSLAEIASAAGVSPTTIYNNFKNRQGLVNAVVQQIIREIIEQQWSIINSPLPIPLKIQKMVATKAAVISDLKNELMEKLSEDPQIKQALDDAYQKEINPMMSRLIEEGKEQGYIRRDIPEEAVILYLDILKEGGIKCSDKLQKIMGNRDMMLALMHICYHGLFQKEFAISLDPDSTKETN